MNTSWMNLYCRSVLFLILCLMTPASARRNRPEVTDAAKSTAQLLLQEGLKALASHDLDTAEKKLSEFYLASPGPEGLYALAQLALAEGKTLQAQDLCRRFLADPLLEPAPDSAEHREAERIVSLPAVPSALLELQGTRGTAIKLDGRPVGVLPLAMPIIATVGEHQIEILAAEKSIRETLRLERGRVYELRYNLSTRALIINILPAALILLPQDELSEAELKQFHAVLASALHKERYSSLSVPSASDDKKECTEKESCPLVQARQLQAEYLVTIHIDSRKPDWRMRIRFTDVEIGATAAESEVVCSGCSPEVATQKLTTFVAPLLKLAAERPRGKVQLVSDPSGASVWIDNLRIGVTPYKGVLFGGRQKLRLVRSRFAPEDAELEVQEGQTTELLVKLRDLPDSTPPPCPICKQQRAKQISAARLTAGLISLSAGVLMIGVGTPAMALHGLCADESLNPGAICLTRFETLPLGASLVSLGAAASLSGVLLLTLPTRSP